MICSSNHVQSHWESVACLALAVFFLVWYTGCHPITYVPDLYIMLIFLKWPSDSKIYRLCSSDEINVLLLELIYPYFVTSFIRISKCCFKFIGLQNVSATKVYSNLLTKCWRYQIDAVFRNIAAYSLIPFDFANVLLKKSFLSAYICF